MSAQEIQNWLVAVSLFVTTIVTIALQLISNRNNQKEFLDKQLIELQRLSFYDPFVEDINYTHQWDSFREQYNNNYLQQEDLNRFLKYDVYTEMLFNFIEISLKVYKTEKKLLKYVDFKSWIRTHSECWKNPLQPHSNREVYGDKMCDMVDKWLK